MNYPKKQPKIEQFYATLEELKEKIVAKDSDAKKLSDDYLTILNSLQENIESKTTEINKQGKSAMNELLKTLEDNIKESIYSWEKTEKTQEETNRRTLRKDTNDSLLVIVYGRVKAGKSTLGNYIAKHSPDNINPNFFVFDEGGSKQSTTQLQELDSDNFATKSTECTSSIQGFKIPGLTWIDTPGLLSTTRENGDLAKNYIEAADLVVFPIPSNDPGCATEIKEVLYLAGKGKEFCALITMSDKMEEDEVDGALVKKWINISAEERTKQEEYVKGEISKCLKNIGKEDSLLGDILSISIKVAEESINSDKNFQESNILLFYEMLNKVVETDSVRLKIESPIKTMHERISQQMQDDNELSLSSIIKTLDAEKERIIQKKNDIDKKCDLLPLSCLNIIQMDVRNNIRAYRDSDSGDGEKIVQEIQNTLKKAVNEYAEESLKKLIDEIEEGFKTSFPTFSIDTDSMEIKKVYRDILISNEIKRKGIGSAMGGIGGLIGFLAGPIGAIIGTTVGSAIGGSIGSRTSSVSKKSVEVGDNFEEVMENIETEIRKALETIKEKLKSDINENIFVPIEKICSTIHKEISATKDKIMKNIVEK